MIDYPCEVALDQAIVELARRLRVLRATTLVYLTASRGHVASVYRDLLFFRLSGFSRVIGAGTKNLRDARIDPATGFEEYECSLLARTLAPLGTIDLDDPKNWDLRLTDTEQSVGHRALAPFGGNPFIAVNMGGKFIENHGQDNWRESLRALSVTHGGYGVLFVGADEEAGAVAESPTSGLASSSTFAENCCRVRAPARCGARASSSVIFPVQCQHILAAAVGVHASRRSAISIYRADGTRTASGTELYTVWTAS